MPIINRYAPPQYVTTAGALWCLAHSSDHKVMNHPEVHSAQNVIKIQHEHETDHHPDYLMLMRWAHGIESDSVDFALQEGGDGALLVVHSARGAGIAMEDIAAPAAVQTPADIADRRLPEQLRCSTCDGKGQYLWTNAAGGITTRACEKCQGTGRRSEAPAEKPQPQRWFEPPWASILAPTMLYLRECKEVGVRGDDPEGVTTMLELVCARGESEWAVHGWKIGYLSAKTMRSEDHDVPFANVLDQAAQHEREYHDHKEH